MIDQGILLEHNDSISNRPHSEYMFLPLRHTRGRFLPSTSYIILAQGRRVNGFASEPQLLHLYGLVRCYISDQTDALLTFVTQDNQHGGGNIMNGKCRTNLVMFHCT